jgi:hypothetical protein
MLRAARVPARIRLGEPKLSRRELAAVSLGACLLAVAMNWPVPAHIGSQVFDDLGDPMIQSWQVAWGGHALAHQPLDFWQANAYWPLRNSLAFSDALVGYAPAGLIGSGPEAALVRYNVLFLFASALAFVATYLLARELGVGRLGAAVAGAAFAYAPWRLAHHGQLQVLSSGGIPLSLFLLLRGYRRRQPGLVVAGWLVAIWHFSLSFTLGLPFLYLLALLALAAAAWLWRRRPPIDRRLVVATAAGVAVFAAAAVVLSRPYVAVLRDHPEARRTERIVEDFSPQLRSYLAAPATDLVWGRPTAHFRAGLAYPQEKTLFPGVAIVALAAAGALSSVYSRRLRFGLAAGAAVCALFALGISSGGVRLPVEPYRVLFDYAPGWEGVRTPGRLNTLTSLALALLAAAGAQALVARVRRRRGRPGRLGRALVPGTGAVLVGVILLEGAGYGVHRPGQSFVSTPLHTRVPPEPSGQRGTPAPQVHLPFVGYEVARYLLWSTDGFPKLANGVGSFSPSFTEELNRRVRSFPDRASVSFLRSLGVRTVVLHPDLARNSPWEGSARKPVRGLPLRREARDGVVLYRLGG